MKIAIYRTDTGEIVETRECASGSVPPLGPLRAWCVAPPECHPDTHMADPMGLQVVERPEMPITVTEAAGEVVVDGIPDNAEVIFHGRRHAGKRRVRQAKDADAPQHLFVKCWPYKPVHRYVGERVGRAEREERRKNKARQVLARVKDPELRAVLRDLLNIDGG